MKVVYYTFTLNFLKLLKLINLFSYINYLQFLSFYKMAQNAIMHQRYEL